MNPQRLPSPSQNECHLQPKLSLKLSPTVPFETVRYGDGWSYAALHYRQMAHWSKPLANNFRLPDSQLQNLLLPVRRLRPSPTWLASLTPFRTSLHPLHLWLLMPVARTISNTILLRSSRPQQLSILFCLLFLATRTKS